MITPVPAESKSIRQDVASVIVDAYWSGSFHAIAMMRTTVMMGPVVRIPDGMCSRQVGGGARSMAARSMTARSMAEGYLADGSPESLRSPLGCSRAAACF